jgi:hypothetical protein
MLLAALFAAPLIAMQSDNCWGGGRDSPALQIVQVRGAPIVSPVAAPVEVTDIGGQVVTGYTPTGNQNLAALPGGDQVHHCGPVTWHGIPVSRDVVKGPLENDANFRARAKLVSEQFAEDYPPDSQTGWPN